ncbi:MAG: hypothetical protein ACR2QO_03135 [Acidimicrobiales bacterium]
MKKFLLIFHGYQRSTPEYTCAWNDWFQRRKSSIVETGTFGPGREITNDRTIEMTLASSSASGYSIVTAKHLDAAEQLLEGCPIVDSVTLYEAFTHEVAEPMTETTTKEVH